LLCVALALLAVFCRKTARSWRCFPVFRPSPSPHLLTAACLHCYRYMKDIEQFYNTQIEEMPANVADLL
jgi:hypothetical protein